MLGEVVSLRTVIINRRSQDVHVRACAAREGQLKVLISRDDKTFQSYRSRHSLEESPPGGQSLKPGQSCTSRETVLYNPVSALDHLSDGARKQILDKQISTALAFPSAGRYSVKTAARVFINGVATVVESKPIRLSIGFPQGDNAAIWDKISNRPEFAFFMQYSELSEFRSPEDKRKFFDEVAEIINRYPNATLSTSPRLSKEKFDKDETERQARP